MANRIMQYYKRIWLALQGKTKQENEIYAINHQAVHNAYEVLIQAKHIGIQRGKQKIGELIAAVEQKKNSLKQTSNEIQKIEQKQNGAKNKIKNIDTMLKKEGISDEEIEKNPDYCRALNSYNDFSTTLKQKMTDPKK